jgi:hypothetical protein
MTPGLLRALARLARAEARVRKEDREYLTSLAARLDVEAAVPPAILRDVAAEVSSATMLTPRRELAR